MMHSRNTIAVPPGSTIREQLENRDMTQKEFALRMDMSEKHISQLINGKVELTTDVAQRLQNVLGLPATFWSNLEAIYRSALKKVELEQNNETELKLAAKFPYNKLSKVGFVPEAKNMPEKLNNLKNFFEVAKLKVVNELQMPGIVFRKNGENAESDYTLAAWAQESTLYARKLAPAPINIDKLA